MAKEYKNTGFRDKKGGKKFAGRSDSSHKKPWDSASERPTLHTATCHACHAKCEVPFKPNGSKPVFCNNCFNRNEPDGMRKSVRERFDRPRSQEFTSADKGADTTAAQLRTIQATLDKVLKLLEEGA